MKKHALAVAILVGLFTLGAAGPVQAQSSFRVNIPFAFVAGETTFAAGEYVVQPPQIGGARALVLQRVDGKGSAILLGMNVQANGTQSETRLVFHRYENGYFLSTMWSAGNRYGVQIRESHREVELAKNETPDQIILLARSSVPSR